MSGMDKEGAQPVTVSEWYDGFTDHQQALGVNLRHRTILRNARRAGLRSGMRVLEIGCGIGTVTSLLAKLNAKGSILAVDISPKSIAIARTNLKPHSNVRFLVSDMLDFTSESPFDFVVLPDVIEHIPVEQHPALFNTIARHLAPTGRALINVPCPQVLEYLHVHDPSVLQLIDQPIHADKLLRDVYAAGLVLDSFTTYGLQFDHAEYHSIVLRPAYNLERLERRSQWALRWAEFRSRLPW